MITKADLEKKVARLEKDNQEWKEADASKRSHLSNFLGKHAEDRFGIMGRRGTDPLSWAEIFFELGKLKEKVHQKNVDDKLHELDSRQTYILEEIEKLRVRPEDMLAPGNPAQYAGNRR